MPFARALIVEDLDEPRQWLTELLPQALPSVVRVDAAADLHQGFALIKAHAYDLAIVDWHLPDGTSEALIQHLVASQPQAMVVVATIHDDDAHVFPALRSGATGYILKSQPRAVVIAQLQRLELGEPALSPSIAMRLLKHFSTEKPPVTLINRAQAAPDFAATEPFPDDTAKRLTAREIEVLRLIAKGYKTPEVGQLLGISAHTVSSYVRDIYRKLGINSRAEATLEASRRGLVA
jgi:DNA-binding NarL/FixJ family response regulator